MSASLATFFVANVPPASPDYDGIEYKFYNFVFRPAQYTTEFYILLAFGTYLTLYLFGKQINKSRARAWFDAHRPILEENFSKPSLATDLIEDGGCDFYMYSTGRVGVKSLHTVFAFQPRHDLLLRVYNLLWSFGDLSYQPCDKIEIDFTLADNTTAPGFVFAIVDKDNIKEFSTNRWDLSFAKTSDNPALSSQYTVFTENADITDQFLKSAPPAANFVSILKDPEHARYFRSLTVTDMPLDAPEGAPPSLTEQAKHVVLTLKAPSSSDSAATKNLVQAAFALVDYINSREFNVRPDTRTKLLKIRKDMETFLAKQVKEKDAEAAEKKRSEKRKAEEERLAKLSAAEQKKHADSERKRNLRKAQTKGAARIRM